MVIKDFYSPQYPGQASGEELVFRQGVGHLLNEIRQCVLKSELLISNKATFKGKSKSGKPGTTGNMGLSDRMNKALGSSLISLGWGPKKAPGTEQLGAKIDWWKSISSAVPYGPKEIGLGLEIQFGNNFQFYADLHRLHEAVLDNLIVAGVCIVASDKLAKYKADRGAFFSQEKKKLDRYVKILTAARAPQIPNYILIGIEHDGFCNDTSGKFSLKSAQFDHEKGVDTVIQMNSFGTLL